MRSKSTLARSSAVVDSVIWPSDASLVNTSTTAPEGTVSCGGIVELHRLWEFSEPSVYSGAGVSAAVGAAADCSS